MFSGESYFYANYITIAEFNIKSFNVLWLKIIFDEEYVMEVLEGYW